MKRLKEIRIKHGITQADIAYRLGITTTQYQRYEAGTSLPRLDTAIRIADLFDVSLDYLVGRHDMNAYNQTLCIDLGYSPEFLKMYCALNDEHREILNKLITELRAIETSHN